MTRQYLSHARELPLETSLGTVFLTPTDANHIHADANSNGKKITVNGVDVSVSFHLFRQDDGKTFTGKRYEHLYAHRRDDYREASDAAKNKIIKVLSEAVTAWVADNEAVMAEAQRVDLNNRARNLALKIAELQEEVRTLQSNLRDIEKEEVRL